ncbi:MAG: hypothetical protein JWQ96_901 [Segetibacter sp.]|nr:hypothetical protein [Segetibacter sp.]
MNYIFLDTNIFIHFIDFEQIPWNAVIQDQDLVTIVIAPTVFAELDKHKYNANARVSGRAKKVLPKIEKYIDGSSSNKLLLHLMGSRPKDNTFDQYGLDRGEQDDSILASIIEYTATLSSADRLYFVTNDFGPRLKARSLNLNAIKPDEKYLAAVEPNPAEIRANALQKELNELKLRIPNVAVTFLDKSVLYSVERRKIRTTKEAFIEDKGTK